MNVDAVLFRFPGINFASVGHGMSSRLTQVIEDLLSRGIASEKLDFELATSEQKFKIGEPYAGSQVAFLRRRIGSKIG